MPGPYSRLKRRPDRTSISMMLASIEAVIVANPKSPAPGAAQAASDMTTDEPEDKAEREASRSAFYETSPAREIALNETLVALTAAPSHLNMSVHNKTVRPAEVTPLDAAALDEVPQPETAKPVAAAVTREEPPQTLAAATAAESQSMDQPGPYHVQVGAFSDREQAKERLENVKEALGTPAVKAHPEFIMPVSMPSGATMFRARLSRFSDEAQAKAACKKLKRNGIECWDIRAQ
jgi:D-alanyl-D-alanine carboxypeptidase